MGLGARAYLFQTALLLTLSSLVFAQHQHGEGEGSEMEAMKMGGQEHNEHEGGHHMALPTAEDFALWNEQSYWSLQDHAGLMYAHIAVMILAWVVILPISKLGALCALYLFAFCCVLTN